MSGRVFLFFPPRGHEPPPTLRDRLNPNLSLWRHCFPIPRYDKRSDVALYTVGPLFLLPTPSSPHSALKVLARVFGFRRWSYQMYVWYLTTVSKYIQQYCYYYAAAVLFFSCQLQSLLWWNNYQQTPPKRCSSVRSLCVASVALALVFMPGLYSTAYRATFPAFLCGCL